MSILHLIIRYVRFNPGVIKSKDDIRISYTTLPGHQKDNCLISSNKLNIVNYEFTINFDQSVEEVLLNFRKKSYVNGDPIIGKSLFVRGIVPSDHTLETEFKIYEAVAQGLQDKFVPVGEVGVRIFVDNMMKPKKISSYYSTPTLQDLPELDLTPDGGEKHVTFFQNIASKFKKNKNFVEIDNSNQKAMIASSKSDFRFGDPF